MDLRSVTTFRYQQCHQSRQQHDREQAFFPLASTQGLLATIAEKPGHTKEESHKLKRKEEKKAMTAKKATQPKKSIQSARLVIKKTPGGTVLARRWSPPQT